ncbi:protein ELF4-LIKE 4-like [Euphorbia lathyris]|uniref:protein ELF4-LIKE 4-like n=1 Tax=Euphorbia lathyris TaxID=212925 RepID=UPI0033134A70
MEDNLFSGIGNGTQIDNKALQTVQKSFMEVQDILDQNRLLISEINQNHESKIPDNLTRNVGLIRELNNNIRRVVLGVDHTYKARCLCIHYSVQIYIFFSFFFFKFH